MAVGRIRNVIAIVQVSLLQAGRQGILLQHAQLEQVKDRAGYGKGAPITLHRETEHGQTNHHLHPSMMHSCGESEEVCASRQRV